MSKKSNVEDMPDAWVECLGYHLRTIRESLGLSQTHQQVVGRSTLYNWECGRNLGTVEAMREVLRHYRKNGWQGRLDPIFDLDRKDE
jgi:hypothetical protein